MNRKQLFSVTEINDQLQLKATEADHKTRTYQKIKERQILEAVSDFNPKVTESDLNNDFFRFCLSFLVLSKGEEQQRTLIKNIYNPRLRNIKFNLEKTAFFLKEAMKIKDSSFKINIAEDMLQRAFQALRKELGLPEIDPIAISYQINDAVISKASSNELKDYLNKKRKKSFIFDNDLNEIEKELKKFSDDYKIVMDALKKTGSREHLSACSISGTEEIPYLSIVSPDSKFIQMESWKFLSLIERPQEPLVLHNYVQTRKYEQVKQKAFTFNNNQKGTVIGKFEPATSSFGFVCAIENNNPIDKSIFMMDMLYILCIYATLRRIHEDRIRFIQLKEQAQSLETYQHFLNIEF